MVRLVVVLAMIAGCLRSDSVVCKNGVTCPSGTLCDDANGGCIVDDQRAACANVGEGMMCTWPDGAGECINGVCLGALCGDGRRSGPERCDPSDPNASMTTCTSVELGYYQGGDVSCTANCTWDVRSCSEFCGDGMLNGNELCEEDIAPVETCVDYGFDRGSLDCGACAPTFDSCGFIGWRRRVLPGTPSRVAVIGTDVVAAIDQLGSAHLAARYDDGSWIGLGTVAVPGGMPTGTAIAATTTTTIWVGGATNAASGDLGFVARYDGTAWKLEHTFPASVSALWASGTNVFAMAGQDLYVYDGSAWASQTLGASAIGFWISGSSTSDVWIGGTKLWHGGASQPFAEVTLPVTGTVSGVSAFGPDQVAVAVYEPTPNRLGVQVRENGTWRAVPYPITGQKQGQPFARAGNDLYLLAIDVSTQALAVVQHHDGSSWVALTDAGMKPTALAGSDKAIVGIEHDIATGYHYGGAVWMPRTPLPASSIPYSQIWGARWDEIFMSKTDSFTNTVVYNGTTTWASSSLHGTYDIVSDTVMYSVEPNIAAVNPRLWRRTMIGWLSTNLPGTAADIWGEWIGALGANDIFLKDIISGVPHYLHWAGNTADDAPLETTNLPDGELLDAIDCRTGVGCYAGGPSTLWRTTGDRNAWEKVTDLDIGPISAIWIAGPTFVAVGGSLGRIAHWNGTAWTISQLTTSAPVTVIVGTSATDAFALTRSVADEHQLHHWNGTAWSRVRTPVPAVGSKIQQLWTGGRISYLGDAQGNGSFSALIRTERW